MSEIADILNSITNLFKAISQRKVLHAGQNKRIHSNQFDVLKRMYDAAWLELHYTIRNVIVPKFWLHFKIIGKIPPSKDERDQQLFQNFVEAVNELHASYQLLYDAFQQLHNSKNIFSKITTLELSQKKLKDVFRESLLGQMPSQFSVVVNSFYTISFNINSNTEGKTNEACFLGFKTINCNGCKYVAERCCCQNLLIIINETNIKLLSMDLLDCIAGQTVTLLVQKQMTDHIKNNCYGIIDRSHLKKLEMWLDEVVLSWLAKTFNKNSLHIDENEKSENFVQCFRVKLTYFLYETFAHSVIEQFFNIIIDFPESIPILDDLKICMEKIDLRKYFIKTIKTSLEARILHPGVNTIDIITGYVAAIKAIRYLDSSGVILETVTAPIKEYLRKRNDTVRRVVTGLTEEGPSDLSEELTKSETLKNKPGLDAADEASNWESWAPDPVSVDQTTSLQSTNINRSADIISMIVDIYGSKELFMNEYRNLMADRLLTQLNFVADKEIRNLELLKIRFGENLLHSCEVMLRDVSDSKRINSHIQSDKDYIDNKSFDIATLIISAQFWPCFNKESLELPEEIENEFIKFTKSYEAYKGNRTLNWRTVTGRVQIEIEISGKTVEMTVSPTQAVIIYHFQDRNIWTLDELSSVIKVPPTVLRRRMRFWQTHGLIKEVSVGTYQLIDDSAQTTNSKSMDTAPYIMEDDDMESAMASASDQREEELQVFWSYIVGMLTNLDSLPIERIHQMLKLFASNGVGIEFTQDDLRNFLQRKVREHKLLYSGGVYQLAK
ncbi:anaphase-promoting complex subunit 2-like [Teleopsis dalmanni]|uniref:anaphase-promoting complex subunit 2-like n=1 Tax=Teleopsis dalmanni TaxID=139649 RepID=UPI0018CDFBAF|nr:anaphase-promoting complex subunit 2-like [Teleopsis dalmanni]